MLILKMANRNLWRNKRRTIIAIVSIVFGMVLCMFFTGISDGSYKELINSAAKLGHGHITIMNKNFFESQDSSYAIKNAVSIEKKIVKLKDIAFIEKKITGSGMLSSAYDSTGITFDAVEPEKNKKFSLIKKKIKKCEYLTKNGRDIIIGKILAQRLKVKIGSKVVLTVNDRNNDITQELFRIRGIFQTGSEVNDGFYALVNFARMQEILKFKKKEASIIAVYSHNYRNAEKLIDKIKKDTSIPIEASAEIYPWFEVMKELAQYISVDKGSNVVMQGFLLLIIAAGILNAVLMSVMERFREFGIMIALGFTRVKLLSMIMCEAMLLAFWGIGSGSVAGWILDYYFVKNPIDLTKIYGEKISISGVAWEPLIKTGLFIDHYFIILFIVFLMVIFFSLYPAFKASRTDPIEAIERNL